jgi:hypothetical protein
MYFNWLLLFDEYIAYRIFSRVVVRFVHEIQTSTPFLDSFLVRKGTF